ncbi:enoyl-CoA hydratase/isomerase family protein [Yinghuangia sp. ASG 101]|uniref:enoyl-CoA hydratase/isomerase family protein n=1 Tax=Yinghuangia sp. ASG 101 TaxID=2896848 RepID=UPI001E3633FE|nr:enoyl-CoA hydratase/isomerase family protein [Yinghuangia sp. ASG 101]UGQ11230.1 enoyl-CoA hydratase/isomerase family protein [Yinghuangia sp. ASG 101]
MTDASTSAATPALTSEIRDRVAVLTLNRPDKLNAIGAPVLDALEAELDRLRDDDRVRALVIAGAGRAFSAGADLDEIDRCTGPYDFRAFVHRMTDVYDQVQEFPKPSVAAIHGFAFGGGLELSLACDLRVAGRGARLGVPEMKLGVLPGAAGTQRLPRLIPPGIAKQMILTGEPLGAERAHAVGLVNALAPDDNVLAAARELAGLLAAGAPRALAAGKQLVDRGPGMDLAAGIAYERETVSVLFSTQDREEGLKAFKERRPPRFTGR